jgi:hypothetical protein
MQQHLDIAVCAHVACWSILRHYSERYTIYREFLTHEITMMAHEFDPGGLIPSKGLEISHAERVFQEARTFPLLVARKKGIRTDKAFYRQLGAYVESAFPLFAAMHDISHAVAVVGYEWRPDSPSKGGMQYAWEEVKSLAVVDDNHLPYLTVPVGKKGSAGYSVRDIDTFIVALPEKVFYPADAVDRVAPQLFDLKAILPLPAKNHTIVRYFITTGSALRHFVRERETEFNPDLLREIMSLPLAQFVWIVEFATKTQWAVGRVEARAVIDATASVRESYPLWLFHNRTRALAFDRKQVGNWRAGMRLLKFPDMGHSGFSRMVQNLRPTQTK